MNRAELLDGPLLSAQVAMLGLASATVVSICLAITMSQARWLEGLVFPYLVLLQATPILALVPLYGFWFGYGFNTRVLVCFLIALFPIVANTLFGLRSVDQDHHDLFTLHGAGRITRLWKLAALIGARQRFEHLGGEGHQAPAHPGQLGRGHRVLTSTLPSSRMRRRCRGDSLRADPPRANLTEHC